MKAEIDLYYDNCIDEDKLEKYLNDRVNIIQIVSYQLYGTPANFYLIEFDNDFHIRRNIRRFCKYHKLRVSFSWY
jgi:hypothetical protein